jgi:tetratricopeptide (TPR) repeat protein/TolB-like protein
MTPFRAVLSSTLPILVLLSLALPADVQAQSAAKVLVAPLTTSGEVDKKFGERVAEEVGKSLEDFDAIEPMDEDEIEEALKRFGLEDQVLSPIQWRQLAGQLKADLVMVGNADPAGGGVHVKATFVQSKSGEELPIPEFNVPGDGGSEAKEASRRIIEAFGAQVTYLKAVQFCQEYLAANQFEDALRNCDEAIALRPDAAQALYFHARTLMGLERWADARPELEQVLEADPAKEDAIQSLAFVCAQLGDTECANTNYGKYLDFNPDDAEVRLNIAFNLAQAGDYDGAIVILQDGLSRDDQNAAMWQYLGNVALAKATASEGGNGGTVQDSAAAHVALDAYRRYVDLESEAIEAAIILNAMKAYLAMGDAAGGFDLSERVREEMEATTDPVTGEGGSVTTAGGQQLEVANITDADRAAFWALRADMLAEMERTDEAVRELGYALEIDPSYPNGFLKRGIFHLQGGAPMEAALADFQRAVDSGSDSDVIASQLLARGYNDHFKKGQIAAALNMFQAGLDFASSSSTQNQLNFFIGYGIYQQAVAIDESNPSEDCQPAQRALQRFQQVPGYIQRAGDVQRASQSQILDATDTYIFRQEQIVKKACRG